MQLLRKSWWMKYISKEIMALRVGPICKKTTWVTPELPMGFTHNVLVVCSVSTPCMTCWGRALCKATTVTRALVAYIVDMIYIQMWKVTRGFTELQWELVQKIIPLTRRPGACSPLDVKNLLILFNAFPFNTVARRPPSAVSLTWTPWTRDSTSTASRPNPCSEQTRQPLSKVSPTSASWI